MNLLKNLKILLHAVIWIWMVYALNTEFVNLEWGPMSRENDTLLIPLILGMSINAVLFYANAYWFIPKLLHTQQNRKYWKWTLLLMFGLTLCEVSFDTIYILRIFIKDSLDVLSLAEKQSSTIELVLMFSTLDLFVNIMFWAMAFLYRLPTDWLRNERQKQQLVQDKLTAELDFLRAQIDPHFLFNGINSIYHLMGEDVEKAQKILLRFSDLLRYQLYECKEDYIPLKKELQYISSYLEIEMIRKGEDAHIKVYLPQINALDNGSPKIAPLLFSPFLENAFKYLSLYSEKERNVLETSIELEASSIHFSVKNTIDARTQSKKKNSSSGIGLENVKRRLNILYPQKHNLSIQKDDRFFHVDLKIYLS